jgi:hypothetical protein
MVNKTSHNTQIKIEAQKEPFLTERTIHTQKGKV